MSSPAVGNLVVWAREGRNDVELPSTSTRYRIIEAFVHLALSVLETEEGRRSLVEVATAIIRARDSAPGSRRRRPPHIYRDSLDNMSTWIRIFLRKMRGNFPPVSISEAVEGEAEAEKYDWGDDMAQYNAGNAAGVLFISEAIISNMTNARRQTTSTARSTYAMFKFQMAISVAHEMLHFLTGFITGTMVPHTPPAVTAEPYGRNDVGEAGRYWERILLGGFVEFWSSTLDPLGVRQAGVPYLFNAGSQQTATGREISMAYVEEFLDEQFTFPIRASSQTGPTTRRALERSRFQETTILRQSRQFRNAGPVSSPSPSASLEARFRRINLGPSNSYAGSEEPSRRYYR